MNAQPYPVNKNVGDHGRFNFWHRWLMVVIECYILFGVFIAFFSSTMLFDFFNDLVFGIFFDTAVPEGIMAYQGWLYGLMGSILLAWGLNMFFIAQNAFKQQQKWAWNALFISLLVWYLIDSALSLSFGVVFNAVINTLLCGLGMLPLIFTRKHFS